MVIKINSHRDKRSSKFSNLNSEIAKSHKLNNKIDLNNAFHDIWFVFHCCWNLLTVLCENF